LRLLVGGAGGSSSDTEGRAFAPFFERSLPQVDVVIVNLAGQTRLEAYRALADAPPDGLAVGWAATPSLPARCIDQNAPDLMQRLTLVGSVQREPIALVAPVGGAADVAGLRALVARGAPFGTPPTGSPSHLAALRLQELLGSGLNLVAFPSAAAVRQAVTSGHVAAAALTLGDVAGALREATLQGVGLASDPTATALTPLLPLASAGLPLVAYVMRGIAAPFGLSAEVLASLDAALRAVTADLEFVAYANTHGFEATWLDSTHWTAHALAEQAELARLWARAPWRDGTR
jgi:tripartite-type tricarboxylate transporter receptor subunit TctC